jgi:hypothetical protein
LFNAKAEIAAAPDEGEPLKVIGTVDALTALAAVGRWKQANFLLVPNSRRGHAGSLRKLSDCQHGVLAFRPCPSSYLKEYGCVHLIERRST